MRKGPRDADVDGEPRTNRDKTKFERERPSLYMNACVVCMCAYMWVRGSVRGCGSDKHNVCMHFLLAPSVHVGTCVCVRTATAAAAAAAAATAPDVRKYVCAIE